MCAKEKKGGRFGEDNRIGSGVVSPGVCFFSYPFWTAEERAVVLQVGVVFVVVCAGGVLLLFSPSV